MKLAPSYLDGALLALNGLPGTLAVLDSHRCILERTWVFDALHDWYGGVSAGGPFARDRRVFAPNWAQCRLVGGSEGLIEWYVRLLARRRPGAPILLLRGTLSVLTATDLEGLAAQLRAEVGAPVICVEREMEDEDWVDGWRRVEAAILRHLPSRRGAARPLVTGYCLFRREGDEVGNLEELERLCAGAGLPMPTWTFDARTAALPAVARRAPRIAFPFSAPDGAAAGGGRTIRVGLPLGIRNTRRWLEALGTAFRRVGAVGALVERELGQLEARLTPFVANALAGKGAVVVADPWTAAGLVEAARELGMGVPLALVLRRSDAPDRDLEALRAAGADEVLVDPEREEAAERLRVLADRQLADVVVGSAVLRDEAERAGLPYVEVSGPSRLEHFAAPAPYLGFRGMLRLAERLGNAVCRREHFRRVHGPR